MDPNNGGIQHDVGAVGVRHQHLEDSLPDPSLGPASEPLVDTLPVPILGRQVFPVSAAAQYPQHAIDEIAVVLGSDSHPSRAPGQKSFDLAPLRGAQFVSLHVSPLSLRWTYTLLLRALILPL